ncbi:MAG TPA: discoidin domain-containing protein, partial [Polyangia bacterium]
HKRPIASQETRRELGLLTDEQITPEGSMWDARPAVIFDTAASTVTWDLGEVTSIRSFAIQADANDTYTIWGSVDGKDYKVFGQIDPVPNHGLRMRTLNVGTMVARYVKFGEGVGDSFFSASEVAAYCQVPSPFPPAMKVVDAPAAPVPPKKLLDYWDNDASVVWEFLLACLGILFLWWEHKVSSALKAGIKPTLAPNAGMFRRIRFRIGRYFARSRVRNAILGVMGVLAFLTYFNFGSFHFSSFIHGHDTFHYYIGSKYFKELSYDRLYECVAIADSEEEPGLRRRVELRKMTNLRTNQVETTADILAHPERCKSHFTPIRWESFRKDLRYIRPLESARRWDDAQLDHGYNATPVWNILGSMLSNLAPASRMQILALDSIDCLLVIFLSLMIGWAFGWRVLAVALLAFSTNHPSRWAWTGGSLLRWDWLFWMGASVCLAKKERFFYAGMCLAYSTLLRVFPMFMFVAPVLAMGYHYFKHRQLERRFLRFFMGAALAVAILLPVSVVTAGGVGSYSAFIHNTLKHQGTPLTNYMGLRTVVDYRPSEVGRLMRNDRLVDPWSRWKDARLKSFREAKPLYFGILICYLVLMGLAVKGSDPWEAIALSATFIAFGVELTNYYYSFVIVVALLYAKREVVGRWLLAATAFTQFIGWAPIKGVPNWLGTILPASIRNAPALKNFGMPTELDEQYTLMSLATLIAFAMIAWDMMVARQAALAPASVPADVKPTIASNLSAAAVVDDDHDKKPTKDAKPREPVGSERLGRRGSGGKRRKRR